jgi:hypothetical protein
MLSSLNLAFRHADIRLTRFVDLEGFPAMRADDFVHVRALPATECTRFCLWFHVPGMLA